MVWWPKISTSASVKLVQVVLFVSFVLFSKSYCGVHSKRRDVCENSPRKTPTSTPKKGTELTDEEKSAEKSRRLVRPFNLYEFKLILY